MSAKHTDSLRKLTKEIQENKSASNDKEVKTLNEECDKTLDLYYPVLMHQAKIYWDIELYEQAEKVFRKSVEFCNENDIWKLNVAHVLFIQVIMITSHITHRIKFLELLGFYLLTGK